MHQRACVIFKSALLVSDCTCETNMSRNCHCSHCCVSRSRWRGLSQCRNFVVWSMNTFSHCDANCYDANVISHVWTGTQWRPRTVLKIHCFELSPIRKQLKAPSSKFNSRCEWRLWLCDAMRRWLCCIAGCSSVERYCPRSDRWSVISSLPRRRLQFAVAACGHQVFVVGGRDGLRTLDVVQVFDIVSRSWSNVTAMNTHRHGLGLYNSPLKHALTACSMYSTLMRFHWFKSLITS